MGGKNGLTVKRETNKGYLDHGSGYKKMEDQKIVFTYWDQQTAFLLLPFAFQQRSKVRKKLCLQADEAVAWKNHLPPQLHNEPEEPALIFNSFALKETNGRDIPTLPSIYGQLLIIHSQWQLTMSQNSFGGFVTQQGCRGKAKHVNSAQSRRRNMCRISPAFTSSGQLPSNI